MLVSLQAGATGYSQNMFVAQKKLSESKEVKTNKSVKTKKPEVQAVLNAEVEQDKFYQGEVKMAATSISQAISGWVLKLICKELR